MKVRFLIIFFCVFGFCGCTQASKKSSILDQPWNEGLFPVDNLPNEKFDADLKQKIEQAKLYVGAFTYRHEKKLDQAKAYEILGRLCASDKARFWQPLDCDNIKKCIDSDKHCHMDYQRLGCSGVAIEGEYFITARHCVSPKKKSLKGRFYAEGLKGIIELPLKRFHLSEHKMPYDIAIFKIKNWPSNRPLAKIKMGGLTLGETVFGLGFPYTKHREIRKATYPWAYGDLRATWGRIIEPNNKKHSYCQFSNNIFAEKPSTWVLEARCKTSPFVMKKDPESGDEYEVRIEKNILLSDSDMIHGLSGSPLFDKKGNLIGIGTTVRKDEPPLNYHPSANAVYSKAENILELLKVKN